MNTSSVGRFGECAMPSTVVSRAHFQRLEANKPMLDTSLNRVRGGGGAIPSDAPWQSVAAFAGEWEANSSEVAAR